MRYSEMLTLLGIRQQFSSEQRNHTRIYLSLPCTGYYEVASNKLFLVFRPMCSAVAEPQFDDPWPQKSNKEWPSKMGTRYTHFRQLFDIIKHLYRPVLKDLQETCRKLAPCNLIGKRRQRNFSELEIRYGWYQLNMHSRPRQYQHIHHIIVYRTVILPSRSYAFYKQR